ncbi:S41 family peptidase [Luteimonas panaciterrae]|uniref:S41 family peptidase n=1 Tax=Luteimonas panaciterrae TaxID=363885 RepID=UPI001CFA27E6|nr:S41 family peptidase [Luteimonas panaciterrae]
MSLIGRRFACTLLLLFAFFSTQSAADPTPSTDTERDARVAAFARLYGVVRYFYPGDSAQDVDWNRLAVLGVAEARAARDETDLQARLRALFDPLGPGIDIARESDAFPAPPVDNVPPLVAWRYSGFPSDIGRIYGSERTARLKAGSDFTALATHLDGHALRGKTLRLRGEIKPLSPFKADALGLWLRVDRERDQAGFFDNSSARAKPGTDWQSHEIIGRVDADARAVFVGFTMQLGDTKTPEAALRRLTLEVDDGAGHWTPIDIPTLRLATDASSKAWWLTGGVTRNIDLSWDASERDTGALRMRLKGDLSNGQLFDAPAMAGKTAEFKLGAGLKARVALTLSDARAKPAAERAAALSALKARLAALPDPKKNIASVDVRQADIVVAWSVFAHFYPYWDVIDADWGAQLPRSLSDAEGADTRALHRRTLQTLVVPTQDAHGTVTDLTAGKRGLLPIEIEPIGGQWVVVASAVPDRVRVGDVVTAIDGVDIAQARPQLESLAAGQPSSRPWKAIDGLLSGPLGESRTFSLQRADGGIAEATLRFDASQAPPLPRPAAIAELKPGLWYLDVARVDLPIFNAHLDKLSKARGLIFDIRGYPKDFQVTRRLLAHLLKAKEQGKWVHVPQYIGPFGELAGYDEETGWNLEPQAPHFGGRAVFLANGGTISQAELITGYAQDQHLGTIMGSTTRGVDGNITAINAPSGFHIIFTGMKVTHHDGTTRYHAIGTMPDVAVEPTLAGIRAGRDEVLEAALKLLD